MTSAMVVSRSRRVLIALAVALAAILVASILGIGFYAAIAIVERFALAWHPSVRGGTE